MTIRARSTISSHPLGRGKRSKPFTAIRSDQGCAMSNEQIASFLNTYSEEMESDNAAIFAGAGLSRPAGFVDWKMLLKSVAVSLGLDVEKRNQSRRHRSVLLQRPPGQPRAYQQAAAGQIFPRGRDYSEPSHPGASADLDLLDDQLRQADREGPGRRRQTPRRQVYRRSVSVDRAASGCGRLQNARRYLRSG